MAASIAALLTLGACQAPPSAAATTAPATTAAATTAPAPPASVGAAVVANPAAGSAPASAPAAPDRAGAAAPALSGQAQVVVGPPGGITVVGQGEAKAQPDVAHISVGVQTQGQTAQEAQAENTTRMRAVIDRLKALGIAETDIQTSGVNVHPQHGREPNQITGYQAMNSVSVTVQDVARAGEILDAAIGAGANMAGNIQFGLKDDTQLRQQALQSAVAAARTKADAIAQAAGLRVTSVQAIIEEGSDGGPPRPMPAAAMAVRDAGPVPVQPGELSVRAAVRVIYGFGQ